MLLCCVPQTAKPAALVEVGLNPPWNQPQLTFLALSRSPMFLRGGGAGGLVGVWLAPEQSSWGGWGSPYTVPRPALFSGLTPPGSSPLAPVLGSTGKAPPVWPEIRLSAPGVDGPNVVSQLLSLIA